MSEFQEGEGNRGCKDFDELTKFNPEKVYIHCLRCDNEWKIDRTVWNQEMPTLCSSCGGQALAHEYIVPNAIPYRWKRKDTRSPFKLIKITDPVKSAQIRRIVRVQSII